jgi:UDP-3-O-[3-hydroxymyristoyl] glucosamine N-acyltransferase
MADFNVTVYTQPFGIVGPVGPTGSAGSGGGVNSLNGKTGDLQGVCTWNGLTGELQGVCTWNGLTGNVTGVTTGVANIFGPLQTFTNGISLGSVFLANTGTGSIFASEALIMGTDLDSIFYSSKNRTSVLIGATLYRKSAFNIQDAIIVGHNNYISATTAIDNAVLIGNNNLGFGVTLTADTGTVVVGHNNLQFAQTVSRSVTVGKEILSGAFVEISQNNVCIGNNSLSDVNLINAVGNVAIGESSAQFPGTTCQNNVTIGKDILKKSIARDTTLNNTIIGYRVLAAASATDLVGNVFIGSCPDVTITPIVNAQNNPAAIENSVLGNYQLMIASGKTAWITGSCAGYVGIGGVTTPLGELHVQNRIVLNPASAPATSTSAGVTGSIAWDNNYLYVCAAGNSWRRAPLSGY